MTIKRHLNLILALVLVFNCFIFSNTSYAEETTTENKDYSNTFDFTYPVHIRNLDSLELTFALDDDAGDTIFYMGMVADYLYINEEVAVYDRPNVDTGICMGTLLDGAKVFRAAYNKYNWQIVQLGGVNYFLYIDPTTCVEQEGKEYTEMDTPYVAVATTSYSSSYSGDYSNYGGYAPSGLSAKEWIAYKESGNNYNAVSASGTYIGKYQLSADKLGGDYSAENQEAVADAYVYSTYGSWEAAQAFWQSHGWY